MSNPSEDKQGGENQKALRLTCDELAAQFETGGAPAQITMIDSLLIATALRQYAVSSCAAQVDGYVLPAVCVQVLIERAEKYGVDSVTFGVMEPGAGPMGLPAYVGLISESVENLKKSITPPESGRMRADPDAVFAMAVNGSLPAEAADRVVREAAAPSTPQPEAPTPRTDAEAEANGLNRVVSAEFARQLERELAEARRERAEAGEQFSRFMLVDHPKALEAASRSASAEPDGYAALLDDKHAPNGFWWAGVWHDEGNAKAIAEKGKQGARIVPVWLAPRSSSAESTKWEEEARRYAQNADFWREKYESALSSTAPSKT